MPFTLTRCNPKCVCVACARVCVLFVCIGACVCVEQLGRLLYQNVRELTTTSNHPLSQTQPWQTYLVSDERIRGRDLSDQLVYDVIQGHGASGDEILASVSGERLGAETQHLLEVGLGEVQRSTRYLRQ